MKSVGEGRLKLSENRHQWQGLCECSNDSSGSCTSGNFLMVLVTILLHCVTFLLDFLPS